MVFLRSVVIALVTASVAASAAAQSAPAPGQSKRDYDNWVGNPVTARRVDAFKRYLKDHGADALPTYQILRTAYRWQPCRSAPFAVPPSALWPRIARTLQLIRREVVPLVGEVEALSGYRDATLNACAGGAPASAHRQFYALDLVPKSSTTRAQLIDRLCRARVRSGRPWNWGLGFYQGRRFHVDTLRYRTWSTDNAPSPCAPYG